MALSLDAWKGLSMGAFSAVSILGAAIAVVMKARANQLYVSCGVLFSGGVLLAGGFVHLLGDSNEQFSKMGYAFPWAYFVAGATIAGLACIELTLDRFIGDYMKSHQRKNEASGDDVSNDLGTAEDPSTQSLLEAQDEVEEHDHSHVHPDNPFSAVLLTIALSIHSIMEGLGIGASQDVNEIRSAFIAVMAHKGFTAFALAQGLVSSGYWVDRAQRKYFYISVATFVLVGLIGIGIGWASSTGAAEENAASATLIGITSGSFIYVAVLEILPPETKTIKRERLSLIPTLFFFLAGYGLMSLLALWV
ncbi:hypothetical protein ACHAWF_006497 [Thalassiosira exigua]